MFENIIGYRQQKEHWQGLIQSDAFPPGLCISGQRCTGRCSCALELSRGLLCQRVAEWQCDCVDCTYMRLLEHENILILGTRDFLSELYCAEEMVEKHCDMQTHMFLYRAMKKLLRRADELLWEGTALWTKGIRAVAQGVHEAMAEWRELCFEYASISHSTADTQTLQNALPPKKRKALIKQAEKLHEALPAYLYPVHILRNVITWTHVQSHGRAKIVILESADMLHESSSNILLKTLEEPPQNVFFVFITSHISSLLPTITSRLRSYVMPTRSVDEEHKVIEKVFRNNAAQLYAKSVSEFLHGFAKQEHVEQSKVAAEHYINASIGDKPFDTALIAFLQGSSSTKSAQVFIESLQDILYAQLCSTTVPPQIIQDFARSCATTLHGITTRNVSAATALEALYYDFVEKAKLYGYEKFLTDGAA